MKNFFVGIFFGAILGAVGGLAGANLLDDDPLDMANTDVAPGLFAADRRQAGEVLLDERPHHLQIEFADEDEPFASHHTASLRAIYDLGDLDRSVFVHTTGQSGNPLSANYDSLALPWSERRYVPLSARVDPKAARANDRLVLKGPGG